MNIYIVSGGINTLHEDFKGPDGKSRVIPAFSVHHSSPAGIDIRGEGTAAAAAAAGMLSGVAKGATIHSVKVFKDDAAEFSAPKDDVLQGLSWIMVRAISVQGCISMESESCFSQRRAQK